MANLYRSCPKCGAGSAGLDVCGACGLIFAKYLRAKFAVPRPTSAAGEQAEGRLADLKALALHIPDNPDRLHVVGRAILLAAILVYGIRLALMDIPSWEMASSFIHMPILVIHEFGHVLFRPFGEFMTLLGGSLFQVALPLAFGAIFLVRNRDPFAASVMLWWSAVAVMDVAPYIYDAAQPQHVLITGRTGDEGAHDFIDVLADLGLLKQARPIGYAAHAFGVLAMALALAWGAWLVWQQYRAWKSSTT